MRVGIDVGVNEVGAIALADDGSTLMRESVPTAAARYEDILDTVTSLVGMVERQAGAAGTVGIGLPGAISAKTGHIKNSNSAYLIGTDFGGDASRRLAREIRIGNDANCFTLSESVDGAAADGRLVLGVILGAGVGAGIVIDKHIIEGVNAIAGEWGHNPLPWSSDAESAHVRCYCGKSGCIEQFLSVPGLQRAYKTHAGLYVSIDEIARAAASRDDGAARCLAEYQDRLARTLAAVINVLDPDTIVVGGPLTKIEIDYGDLHRAVARYAFTDRLDTKIVPALHPELGAVRGAAMLWPAEGT